MVTIVGCGRRVARRRSRVLVLARNPTPARRGCRNPLPEAGSLASGRGGPISPLRKGRQVVFGPPRPRSARPLGAALAARPNVTPAADAIA